MRIRTFESEQWLPQSRDELFAFFADARNLDAITPPWLNFHTLTPGPIAMGEGTLIDYKLRVHGVPIRWRTQIQVWDPPRRFVDEQIRGPYRLWVHEHTFEPRDGGTLMRDHVRFAVPFDFIAYPLLVRRDVQTIFNHRSEQLRRQFGGKEERALSPAGSDRRG